MKAEHRKELETNALADRMGHALQNLRKKPDRRGLLYGIAAGAVLVMAFLTYRYYQTQKVDTSERWVQLEDGAQRYIKNLIGTASDTNAGKAARLQAAWIRTWEDGLKMLGQNPAGALLFLDQMADTYRKIQPDVEGDPVFEPEVLYALAVIEETNAVRNRKYLDSAQKQYEKLAETHKDSAHGKLAADRAEALKDTKKRAEIAQVYQDLQISLRVPENLEQPKTKGLPGLPGLPTMPEKK